jgi:hypothetical protein
MVIPAAVHGGVANQHSISEEKVMGDTNGTSFVNEIAIDDRVTSEVVELGDVVEETKGSPLGILLDGINAYMYA